MLIEMDKKGSFVWDHLGQLVLVLAVLIVLLVVILLLKDNLISIWNSIKDFLRFGTG
jgi:hypothetical protein